MSSFSGITVFDRAAFCEKLLVSATSQFEGEHLQQAKLHLRRFKLWAGNVGVYAPHQRSLDSHLRDAPAVLDAVLRMLDVLEMHISRANNIAFAPTKESNVDQVSIPTKPHQSPPHHTPATFEHYAVGAKSRRLEQLHEVERALDRLDDLSAAIRRARPTNPLFKGARFISRDEDGNDINQHFQDFVKRVLEVRCSKLNSEVRKRLAAAICTRRRQFLYFEEYQNTVAKGRAESSMQRMTGPSQVATPAELTSTFAHAASLEAGSQSAITRTFDNKTSTYVTAATAALEANFIRTTTEASSASTVASSSMVFIENFAVPSPPKVLLGRKEAECPYCKLVETAEVFKDKRKWKHHLKADIIPYICLFEICPYPDNVFHRFRDWRKHLKLPHPREWLCPICQAEQRSLSQVGRGSGKSMDNQPSSFRSQTELEGHITTVHTHSVRPSQVPLLCLRSTRHDRLSAECPFCDDLPDFTAVDQSLSLLDSPILKHVGEHLWNVALMALPARIDEECVEDDDSAGTDVSLEAKATTFSGFGRSSISFPPSQHSYIESTFTPSHDTLLRLQPLELYQTQQSKPEIQYQDTHMAKPSFNSPIQSISPRQEPSWKVPALSLPSGYHEPFRPPLELTRTLASTASSSVCSFDSEDESTDAQSTIPTEVDPQEDKSSGHVFRLNNTISFYGETHVESLQYLRLLRAVNPEDERRRILTVKDKLVTESYSWILQDESFQSWLYGDTNNLLWIKGGPGKGKTMMMAGLIDFLSATGNSEDRPAVSYFFCRNSETEYRKVTSIVKSLIYMLAFREKSLVDHLKKKYEEAGENVFTGPRALFTLWLVLEHMLRDFHGARVYLLVDGLDECDDPELDDFLRLLSGCDVATPGKIKWLVTSRPFPRIEDIIGPSQDRHRISLETETRHVSAGVETFINAKVNELRIRKKWSSQTAQKVHAYLQSNAEGTFLWVALVCQRLRRFPPWKVEYELANLAGFQRGLDSFYDRMMQAVGDENPDDAELCIKILRTTTIVYRPLHLRELGTVVTLPHRLQSDDSPNFDALRDLIERCGSFILVHEDTIDFVHQSAKDYLSGINGFTRLQEHTSIAEKCLDTLCTCLKDHHFPDPTSLSKQRLGDDELRLLSRISYACSYWIHHTLESVAQTSFKDEIPNQGKIRDLLESRLIAWVHALGSLKEVTVCVRTIKALLNGIESTNFFHMMQDTYRFLRLNRHIVEESPNQAYTSALLFAPKSSWIRKIYQNRIPKWIKLRTRLNDIWGACLETLLGHSKEVQCITFSSDGSLLASKSEDCTRLWETETGKCRGMLSHNSDFEHLAFSPDDRVLVTESRHNLVLLDTTTGFLQNVLVGHRSRITRCLFAPDSKILASADYLSVKLWDVPTGLSCGTLELQGKHFGDMAFSHDSKRIVFAFESDIQVRDLHTSNVVATFTEHLSPVFSVQFSPDSRLILSASYKSIWLSTSGSTERATELVGHGGMVTSAKFSPDGSLVASIESGIVILFEVSTGIKLHVLAVPDFHLREAMFSPDGKVIMTPLRSGAKIWDPTTGYEITSLEAIGKTYEEDAQIVTFSNDGSLFAEAMNCNTRIWDVATGTLQCTLEGHSAEIRDLAFCPAGGLIASASNDRTIKLWSLDKSIEHKESPGRNLTTIKHVTLSLDGTVAAVSLARDDNVCLWDLDSGLSRDLPFESGSVIHQLAISPDKSLLAACSYTSVQVWETGNGALRYSSEESHYSPNNTLSFSPDSSLLKIELADGSTRVVESHAEAFKNVLRPSQEEMSQPGTSPDGRFLVGLDSTLQTARLWERQKDSKDPILKLESRVAAGVATFSPDSRLIAFVSNEGFINVWETETGTCHDISSTLTCCTRVLSFSHDNRFIVHTFGDEQILGLLELSTGVSKDLGFIFTDPANFVTFSPDSSILAAVSGNAILLWETTSGQLSGNLEHDDNRVNDMVFLPNRNVLVAGYEDGAIRSWDTDNHVLLHTLSTRDRIPWLSLDSKRNLLWIGEYGAFLADCVQPSNNGGSATEAFISVENDWILFKGERVVWLPPDFSPFNSAWAATDKVLIIGHHLRDATIVNFDV